MCEKERVPNLTVKKKKKINVCAPVNFCVYFTRGLIYYRNNDILHSSFKKRGKKLLV